MAESDQVTDQPDPMTEKWLSELERRLRNPVFGYENRKREDAIQELCREVRRLQGVMNTIVGLGDAKLETIARLESELQRLEKESNERIAENGRAKARGTDWVHHSVYDKLKRSLVLLEAEAAAMRAALEWLQKEEKDHNSCTYLGNEHDVDDALDGTAGKELLEQRKEFVEWAKEVLKDRDDYLKHVEYDDLPNPPAWLKELCDD